MKGPVKHEPMISGRDMIQPNNQACFEAKHARQALGLELVARDISVLATPLVENQQPQQRWQHKCLPELRTPRGHVQGSQLHLSAGASATKTREHKSVHSNHYHPLLAPKYQNTCSC